MTSSMQRASASILAVLAFSALAGCGKDEKVLPDPTRPPKPVTFHSAPHGDDHARSLQIAPEISVSAGGIVAREARVRAHSVPGSSGDEVT